MVSILLFAGLCYGKNDEKLIFYFLIFIKMKKTKIYDNICYIDKDLFYNYVSLWDLEIDKEYPNEKIKLCKDWIEYHLMDRDNWIIRVCKNSTYWSTKKYCVECNTYFPSEVVCIDKKLGYCGCWKLKMMMDIFAGDLDYEEYWSMKEMYSDDKNWPRRKMLIDAGFEVVDVEEN